MTLTTVWLLFTLSIVFSAHALKLSDNNPTKSADETTYSCKVGDSKAEKCCTLTKKTNEDVPERPDDFRPTVPGHSPGVGHSFTCSFTQSVKDDTSEEQSCDCQKAECQSDDNCNARPVNKKKL